MSTKNKTVVTAEPGKQELFITREFDAPRELVYKAHTDASLYAQWLGPHGYEIVLETFDTMRLEKLPNDRTKITIHSVFQSVADRDGMVASGMESGVREGYERLDDLLAGMK